MAGRNMPIEEQKVKWRELKTLQATFPNTQDGLLKFANYVVNNLILGSPDINRVQADMLIWLFMGHKFRMIQAQRGQAKTTLTAIYGIFRLIHEPEARILIISAGGKMSKEIASWAIQILNGLDVLKCMVADRNAGDRSSVEGYDIHWVLKGANKSPSIKCLGVDASVQGSRADVLIADDIESMKNARTQAGRELLEDLTKEFESVCAEGDIIYLGTPQSSESIYNNLPSRGYKVRVWTGRYPNAEELPNYGGYLAPMLIQDMLDFPELQIGGGIAGTQGQPTCPEMFDNDNLIDKEVSQGKSKFQLQFMLNTSLADEDRYPLKPSNLVVMEFGKKKAQVMPIHSKAFHSRVIELPSISNRNNDRLYWGVKKDYDWADFERSVMYIDPAGSGKNDRDETAYAVIKLIGAYVYITDIGGVTGGFEEEKLQALVDVAKENDCKTVLIEKNFGGGAHASMLRPLFSTQFPVEIEEIWETGQKELRIIDTLEPVMSSHRLIISPEVVRNDTLRTGIYATDLQKTYSLLYQMAMITRDRGCLRHDDRLDALAGAVRFIVDSIDYDTAVVISARKMQEQLDFIKEWTGQSGRNTYEDGKSSGKKAFGARNSRGKSRFSRK
jgi:hypothetical protein